MRQVKDLNKVIKMGTSAATENKKRIAILFGGKSSEYQVSLQSAYAVISHIDTAVYTPVLIGITKDGCWYLYEGNTAKIPKDLWFQEADCTPVALSMDQSFHGFWLLGKSNVEGLTVDAALPILHGKNGEDGTVQGALELAGIKIIGCGVLSSVLCMDKDMAHKVVAAAGIRVPKSFVLRQPFEEDHLLEAAGLLGYPLFVKPVRAGSSFGITKVISQELLLPATEEAFAHDSMVILEENIDGFEVGCAILGNRELTVGVIDEIELSGGFFDFQEKYSLKSSTIHVPARIAPEQAAKIKEAACNIYRSLGCEYFARVDMFLTPKGEIYFNEVNTIPGFTTHSRYPGMLCAAGMSFDEIVQNILALGVAE